MVAAAPMLMWLTGCGVDLPYILSAISGQADLLERSVPIDEAIETGTLSEPQLYKLRLIRDVRDFAGDRIGLNIADNYTLFFDSGQKPVAYNISASAKDALEPRIWRFPIVGTVPYLGFFDLAAADAKFDALVDEGLDALMYEIDAYSTLGALPNPVLSPMLDRSELDLVETVIHELLHGTIWHRSETNFNESLATFVGRTGTVAYLEERFPHEPERVEAALAHFEDVDRYQDFAAEFFEELEVFYASDAGQAEKIAGREAVFQAARDRFAMEIQPQMHLPQEWDWVGNLPTNNAWLLGNRRYNQGLGLFEGVFARADGVWAEALDVFEQAASADDPYAYVEAWPRARTSPAAP